MRVLLIAGGWSSERDVSLAGSKGVEAALKKLGHTVQRFELENSLDGLMEAARNVDFAFIMLHGSPGEDGLIQAILDLVGCPYQGSGAASSFLALNKAGAKHVFRDHGLQTPDWVLLTKKPVKGWQPPFAFPVFIKSNTGGSSLQMEKVAKAEDLDGALDRLFAFGGEYLVEPAVPGMELTCGVLGQPDGSEVALAPILIRPKGDAEAFFDYTNKYSAEGAEELCPAPVSPDVYRTAQEMALAAHKSLGLYGYSRSDFMVRPDGSLYILEVNTLPGMTPTSLIPKEAAHAGLSFEQLIERLLMLGIARAKGAAA